MANTAEGAEHASPDGDDDGLLWQCMVRNLDWYVTQTILKNEAVASGNVSFDDILELRMCRSGAFFPGRMCSAFFTFQSKESAGQLRDSWNGRVIPAVSSQGSTSLTCKVVSHAKNSGFTPSARHDTATMPPTRAQPSTTGTTTRPAESMSQGERNARTRFFCSTRSTLPHRSWAKTTFVSTTTIADDWGEVKTNGHSNKKNGQQQHHNQQHQHQQKFHNNGKLPHQIHCHHHLYHHHHHHEHRQ